MSDKFNGFSQDEINRMSGSNKQKKITAMESMKSATLRGGHGGIRRMPTDKNDYNRRQQQKMSQTKSQTPLVNAAANINIGNGNDHKNKMAEKLKSINANNDSLDDINPDRSLSKSIEEALFYQPLKTQQQQQQSASRKSNPIIQNPNAAANNNIDLQTTDSSSDSSILKLNHDVNSQISSTTSSLDDSSILPSSPAISKHRSDHNEPETLEAPSPFKGISLKDFESHRKMIEEQNRQKKEMLYKAIEQHSKKTAAETRKIEEIKAELAKLDNDLAVDVALLRKQIDNACIHFSNVEKHYMKIESQFLKAKMDLHNASEKKELLTEHLCTVIAHNEDRKAQKLTELMEKVGLTANRDYEPPTSTSN